MAAVYATANSPELNAFIKRFRESYSSVCMSRESKKIEEIKQRLVEFWQCTILQHLSEKSNLLGSAEAQVI